MDFEGRSAFSASAPTRVAFAFFQYGVLEGRAAIYVLN
jgi:hypothetical protein